MSLTFQCYVGALLSFIWFDFRTAVSSRLVRMGKDLDARWNDLQALKEGMSKSSFFLFQTERKKNSS